MSTPFIPYFKKSKYLRFEAESYCNKAVRALSDSDKIEYFNNIINSAYQAGYRKCHREVDEWRLEINRNGLIKPLSWTDINIIADNLKIERSVVEMIVKEVEKRMGVDPEKD